MSYGRREEGGKDTVYFLTREDIESSTAGEQESVDDQSTAGAYNPETKEINWDCPCLGGMAKGPCGEEFKSAFSCFVFSEAEPKGSDCVSAFQAMQSCFQDYPEYYADQLREDEKEGEESGPGDREVVNQQSSLEKVESSSAPAASDDRRSDSSTEMVAA